MQRETSVINHNGLVGLAKLNNLSSNPSNVKASRQLRDDGLHYNKQITQQKGKKAGRGNQSAATQRASHQARARVCTQNAWNITHIDSTLQQPWATWGRSRLHSAAMMAE